MKNNFVVATPQTQSSTIRTIELQLVADGIGNFDIVATLPSGRKTRIAGVRDHDGKLQCVRWMHPEDDELNEFVVFDGHNRIRNLF